MLPVNLIYGEETVVSDRISIRHALKKYGENVIIPDLSLEIKEDYYFRPELTMASVTFSWKKR